jgi:hypothetical protein
LQITTSRDLAVRQVVACIGLTNAGCIKALLAPLTKIAMALIFRCDRGVAENVHDLALILVPYGIILDLFEGSSDYGYKHRNI